MNFDALTRLASDLGETAADPRSWPERLQAIADATGAFGAALLQTGTPTTDVPWSPSLHRVNESYYRGAWHLNDLRAMRSVAVLRRGLTVVSDEDLVTPDEFAHHPYYEDLLARHGLRWFAAVTFRPAGSDPWGLAIQRTPAQGAFTAHEKDALTNLVPRLTHAADLARLIGQTSLASTLRTLDRIAKPALAIGASGVVHSTNEAAEALFDDDFRVRAGAIVMADKQAGQTLAALLDTIRSQGPAADAGEPIVVRRHGRPPLILRAIPLDEPAGSLFSGAQALILINDPSADDPPACGLLRSVFGLTGAEARLAAQIASGLSVAEAAMQNRTTRETARSQLKSVLLKTGTNKQAALVGLLARL